MAEPTDPTTQIPAPPKILTTILTDVRLVLGSVAILFAGGFVAYAQVERVASAAATQQTAGLDASVRQAEQALAAHAAAADHVHEQLRDEVVDLRTDVRDTKREVEGLRRDLRLLFPSLPRASDGGTP